MGALISVAYVAAMIARFLRSKWVVLALGILMVVVAFVPRGVEVTCDGQVMRPGQTCEHGGVTYSYDAQKADQTRPNAAIGWAGGALTLVAAGWIVWSMRRRRPSAQVLHG